MVKDAVVLCCLLLTIQGCRQQDGLVPRKIEKEIDVAIKNLGSPSLRSPWLRVTEMVQSVSNANVRAACRKLRQDKLYAIELNGTDYNQQLRLFERVWVGLHPDEQVKEVGAPWRIEDKCQATIRLFRWMRRELNRWKEMVLDGSAAQLKNEDPHKYESWLRTYRWCLDLYESQVSLFEHRFDFFCESCNATAEERSRAKALVEAFLGRPMRTKEQQDRDRRTHKVSDEMRTLL